MKFGVYLALVGAISATKITRETGMTDKAEPVPRSSQEAQSLVQHGHGDEPDSSDEEKEEHHEAAAAIKPKDETHVPELTFRKSYDHENYGGD